MAEEMYLPIEEIHRILGATVVPPLEQKTPSGTLARIRTTLHRVRMVFREPNDAEFIVSFTKEEFNVLKTITEHVNPALNSDTAILAQHIFNDIKDVH